MADNKSRIWELDFLRGFAILIMLYGHFMYDLAEIASIPVVYEYGFTYYLGRVGAFLFISVSGISCVLSRSNLKRGLKLLLIALALSGITYLLGPEFFIKFGILHFLSTCMIFYPIVSKFKIPAWIYIILGAASLILGKFLSSINDPTGGLLFPLGIINPDFESADYYPIFPYIGIFILGIAFGQLFYKKEKKSLLGVSYIHDLLAFAGRHSLFIYLVHQPLLVGGILLVQQIFS